MTMRLHRVRALRRLVLPLLRRWGGDITIRHHWTQDPFRLNVYKHKGYWYHGRAREHATMALFGRLVGEGELVIEVGGHIGYVSLYLANLVSPSGRVLVFEPAPDNLRYIEINTRGKRQVSVVPYAVTNREGRVDLYVEGLTGQNNSLLSDYSLLEKNREWAFAEPEKHVVEVECTTLDQYLSDHGMPSPSFVKIDAEGSELSVLEGMHSALRERAVALMVEVTDRVSEVLELLRDAEYEVFRPDRSPVGSEGVRGNVFCVKRADARIEVFWNE